MLVERADLVDIDISIVECYLDVLSWMEASEIRVENEQQSRKSSASG